MKYNEVVKELSEGRSVTLKPRGNSMTPIIKSGQKIVLSPFAETQLPAKGDVVLAKVNGRYFIHKITAIRPHEVQISNNHGHVNGWAHFHQVYGIVTEIGE